MSATTWLIIAIVGFSLSGVALAVAVFMFIKMDIPAVIGDLTGKTVAREIKAMRDANASSGDKLHRSSRVNVDRGKLTEKVSEDGGGSSVMAAAHASKRLDITGSGQSAHLRKGDTGAQYSGSLSKGRTTESLSTNVGEVDIEERRSTAILSQNRVTDVLSETRQTEVLNEADSATDARGGTSVLSEAEELVQDPAKPVAFKVTKSVIKTHTDEVI